MVFVFYFVTFGSMKIIFCDVSFTTTAPSPNFL